MPVSVMERVTVFRTTNTKKRGHPMTQRGPGPDKDAGSCHISILRYFMELTSKKVKHIFSGEGVITKATDTKIYVDFNGNVEIFKFPDAFINRSLSLIPIELNNFLLLRKLST